MATLMLDRRLMSKAGFCDDKSSWGERLTVVAVVVLAHLLLIDLWRTRPQPPKVAVNEISISFSNVKMPQAVVAPKPEIKLEPKPKPKPRPEPKKEPKKESSQEPKLRPSEPEMPAAPQSDTQNEVVPAPNKEALPSPVQLDTEPDYQAEYLNNPRPPYPSVARRMGYQGRVVLNVEVLAEGRVGEISIYRSSGYDILDQAALQTIKTWKFLPARRLGQPVTRWFLVPINFSLEDEE